MSSGFADLQIGGLEVSNVNITDELTAMIKAQQQFNGSARLMQANRYGREANSEFYRVNGYCEVVKYYSSKNVSKSRRHVYSQGCSPQIEGDAANKPQKPTNAKSIDSLFEKFDNLLMTSETATNLRVRKRFGIVHGEASLTGTPHEKPKFFDRFKKRKKSPENNALLKKVIEEANVELKANAIKVGANAIWATT